MASFIIPKGVKIIVDTTVAETALAASYTVADNGALVYNLETGKLRVYDFSITSFKDTATGAQNLEEVTALGNITPHSMVIEHATLNKTLKLSNLDSELSTLIRPDLVTVFDEQDGKRVTITKDDIKFHDQNGDNLSLQLEGTLSGNNKTVLIQAKDGTLALLSDVGTSGDFVDLTTNQTVAGEKTFTETLTVEVGLNKTELKTTGVTAQVSDGGGIPKIDAISVEAQQILFGIDVAASPHITYLKSQEHGNPPITVLLPEASGTIALLSDITGTNTGTNTGDQDLSGFVDLTTNQTIDGEKTFEEALTVSKSGYVAATNEYVTVFNGDFPITGAGGGTGSAGVLMAIATNTVRSNTDDQIPYGYITARRQSIYEITLVAQGKEDGASQINSRLQIGNSGRNVPDQANMNTLDVNGNIVASESVTASRLNLPFNTAEGIHFGTNKGKIYAHNSFVDFLTIDAEGGNITLVGNLIQLEPTSHTHSGKPIWLAQTSLEIDANELYVPNIRWVTEQIDDTVSAYVPYTGAIADVDLGVNYGITSKFFTTEDTGGLGNVHMENAFITLDRGSGPALIRFSNGPNFLVLEAPYIVGTTENIRFPHRTGDIALVSKIVETAVDYTAITNDFIAVDTTVATRTITLPLASSSIGIEINISKIDASSNDVIIDTTSSELINGQLTLTLTTQWDNVTLVSIGTYWIIK